MERKSHILVVDDEPNVLVTYRLILQQRGYEVSAAVSSEEARTILARDGIDLLLCDLSLEKQENGFDVVEFARQKDPRMPALMLIVSQSCIVSSAKTSKRNQPRRALQQVMKFLR